jgi:hypothetical protein
MADRPHVDLGTPPQHDSRAVAGRDGEADALGSLEDGLAEADGIHVQQRRTVGSVRSVEADRGVDVDDAAGLELDHLRVRHPGTAPECNRGEPAACGERAGKGDGEPPPELGCVPLPEHVRGVVVALPAQRLAQLRILVAVPGEAVQRPTMGDTGRSRRARHGPLRPRPWTGPNDGAVRVAKVAGWVATDSGTSLPPARPQVSRCQASPLYSREHDGHTVGSYGSGDELTGTPTCAARTAEPRPNPWLCRRGWSSRPAGSAGHSRRFGLRGRERRCSPRDGQLATGAVAVVMVTDFDLARLGRLAASPCGC